MSSFFDTMIHGLNAVERHVGSCESPNGEILYILALLVECVDNLHDLDHEMKGAINRHPRLSRSFRGLHTALTVLTRQEDNNE